jgi:hypothetical protein
VKTSPNRVVLWTTPQGLCCSLVRHERERPFEVTISRGSEVLVLIAYESDEDAMGFVIDAAAFAIAEMRNSGALDPASTAAEPHWWAHQSPV